ncbi:fluoride efflux transporter FluC [Streptomyces sp. H27-D2]|uniref:fluoride efflux transporter FluC n=1 Tax=Streptomyces sp. H27-D2 TaxID=3046304 RepID=UPI002DB8B12D|nr:CrcB family protein [Streptomyces sp. H27-D2]MEC4018142.1 CrcB family protein [Streptomyces sp. H27-D2]
MHIGAQRAETAGRGLWRVLAVIAAGGALGASARYGVSLAWPVRGGAFPWGTFGVNVAGCALIGVLMVLVSERGSAHPLVRPFLGTGVLGGFTTFSTYAVDISKLLAREEAGGALTAVAYLAGTLVVALGAVWAAAALTRAAVSRRQGGAGAAAGRAREGVG